MAAKDSPADTESITLNDLYAAAICTAVLGSIIVLGFWHLVTIFAWVSGLPFEAYAAHWFMCLVAVPISYICKNLGYFNLKLSPVFGVLLGLFGGFIFSIIGNYDYFSRTDFILAGMTNGIISSTIFWICIMQIRPSALGYKQKMGMSTIIGLLFIAFIFGHALLFLIGFYISPNFR